MLDRFFQHPLTIAILLFMLVGGTAKTVLVGISWYQHDKLIAYLCFAKAAAIWGCIFYGCWRATPANRYGATEKATETKPDTTP